MIIMNEKDVKPHVCAIYTRISEQEKGEISKYDTIAAQRDISEKYVRMREEHGWTIVKTRYDDRNYSGGTLDRPALKQLIADAKQKKFTMVVVKAIDRFTRNLKHFYKLWDVLSENGINLVSATQEFNTATPTGRLLLDIILRFAQFEREMASERTRDKMRFRASKGLFHGGYQPLGYDFVRSQKGLLHINQKEVSLVRLIFNKYIELQSAQLTARFLNEKGYRTKTWKSNKGITKGGNRFSKGAILSMLQSPVYIGRTGTLEESFKAKWKGIISQKVFDRVQRILKVNRKRRVSISKNKHSFLLTGLIWCGHCGSQMTPNPAHSKGRAYLYYRCSKVIHSDKTACVVGSVPARAIETLILDRITFLAKHPLAVELIAKKTMQTAKKSVPILRKEHAEIAGQLTRVKNKAAVLMKALGKRRFSFIQEQLEPLEAQRTALESRFQEVGEKLEQERRKTITPDLVTHNLKYFVDLLGSLSFERRRDLLQMLIKRITYTQDASKLKVEYYNLPDITIPPGHSVKKHPGGLLSSSFDRRTDWLPRQDSNL